MNWDTIKGNWNQLKGKVKQEWGELTDDDITKANGDRDVLKGILQEKYGKSKEEIDRQVDAWTDKVA